MGLADTWSHGAYPPPSWIDAAFASPLSDWTLRGLWTLTLLSALGSSSSTTYTLAGISLGVTGLFIALPLGQGLYRRHRRLRAGNALVAYDNALLDAADDAGPRLREASLFDSTWRAVLVPGWGLAYNGHPWIGGLLGLGSAGLIGYGLYIEQHGIHPYANPEIEHGFLVTGTCLYSASVLFSLLSARPSPDLYPPTARFGFLPQPGGGLVACATAF